jgi:BlaI family penicillinase repressor
MVFKIMPIVKTVTPGMRMISDIPITASEWHVMEAVWKLEEATAGEICAEMEDDGTPWHRKTIMTFVRRLLDKGALNYWKVGRDCVYSAAVTREECLLGEVKDFMEFIGKKKFAPLLKLYIAYHRPGEDEMEELREALRYEKK